MTAPLCLPLAPSPAGDAGRGLLRMPVAAMTRLGLHPGDCVSVQGARMTHARVLPQAGSAQGPVQSLGACATLTANAGAQWGTAAQVKPVSLPDLTRLDLRATTGAGMATPTAHALCDMIATLGDVLEVPGHATRFEVVAAEPAPAGHITPATRISLRASAGTLPDYEGIAGLSAQIALVHDMVEVPLLRPDLFARLGVPAPRGLLFIGPPGTGKTLLARAVAARTRAAFFHISGPEILSKHYGDSEAALRKLFEAAQKAAPAILFIDEIDSIAPRREGLSGEKQVERRVVAQLLTLMDGMADRGRVVVMAATNLPDALDPALRRPGRFDREVIFTAPDAGARAEILALHLARAPMGPDADVPAIAARAHGYVGADLAALAAESAMAALARATRDAGRVEDLAADALWITQADLLVGLGRTRPSALRDVSARPAVRFADVGGLAEAKQALTQAVLWPLANPGLMQQLRLAQVRGVMLAGPPGVGKTLLVQALAGESGLNFVAVPPARLLSQFLGEAERAVADLFRRARHAAPCLLFFDELDALAPRRGRGDPALDRIVAQFLLELDGLGDNAGLVVAAATNRAADIDPALLRPGRFDLVIPVGLPDADGRAEILAVHLRHRPVSPDLDIATLARATEGWSPAALAALADAAARHALGRGLADSLADSLTEGVRIDSRDISAALSQARASAAARLNMPQEDT